MRAPGCVATAAIALALGCSAAPKSTAQPTATVPDAAPQTVLGVAIGSRDWTTTLQILERHDVALDAATLDVLAKQWPAFVVWLEARGSTTSAYFTLARVLRELPTDGAVRGLLVSLGERAADAEVELARKAKGAGGSWLHASLAARIAGGRPPRVAAAALVVATRPDLDFTPVAAGCSWVNGPARREGRHVEVVTVGLSCTLRPEKTWKTTEAGHVVRHRAFGARIAGTATLRWDGGEQLVPLEAEVAVDEAAFDPTPAMPQGQAFSALNFEQARPETVRKLNATLLAAVTRQWAAVALAAGTAALAQQDLATAEDRLVLHARFAGAASRELDDLMLRYGVTYAELQ